MDRKAWPELKERVAALFRTKTRDEWCKIMEGSDICFAPVLSMAEAPKHPHNQLRGTFVESDGVRAAGVRAALQPHAEQDSTAAGRPGEHTEEALRDWGFSTVDLAKLRGAGAIGVREK